MAYSNFIPQTMKNLTGVVKYGIHWSFDDLMGLLRGPVGDPLTTLNHLKLQDAMSASVSICARHVEAKRVFAHA